MKTSIDDRVTYYENSVGVAKTLRERGYNLASSIGVKTDEPDTDVVGILKPREPLQRSFFRI